MESGAAAGDGGNGGFLSLTKPSSIDFHQKSQLPFKNPTFYSHYNFCRSNITIFTPTRYSRRVSNAENVGSQKFKFKFRNKNNEYSGNDDVEEQKEEEEEVGGYRGKSKKRRWWSDERPGMEEEEVSGIMDEAIDSFWIFEVFKSYGWALPPIIIFSLLANGPKAFLITLAIPLGQSALTFVYNLLSGKRTHRKPKRKARKRRKPFFSSSKNMEMNDKEQEEMQENVRGNPEFRSWIVNEDGSVNRDSQDSSYFGGWDELDGMEPKQRPPRRAGQSRRTPSTNGKLGKKGRKSDAPLLLRLLIAVFPFLGSWTKML